MVRSNVAHRRRASTFGTALLALLAFLGMIAIAGSAAGAELEFTLENGLRVALIGYDGLDQTPTARIAVTLLFDIGEVHDPEGRSGFAHLIEHLLVTCGAGTIPARTSEEWFAAHQNQANAQTGWDYTLISTVGRPSTLEVELRDVAARLHDLRVTPVDLARELPRVEQELANMFGGIPSLAAMNHAQAAVDPLPEGSRKGGRIEQLRDLTAEQITERVTAIYTPARARLIVAGAFDPKEIRSKIEAIFGAIPAREGAPLIARTPPPSRRGVVLELPHPPGIGPGPGKTPALVSRFWKAPDFSTPAGAAHAVIGMRLASSAGFGRALPGAVIPSFAPIDNPRVIGAMVELREGETAMEGLARIDAAIEKASASLSPREIARSIRSLATYFDLAPAPAPRAIMNPYLTSMTFGRRVQCGIDRSAMKARFNALTPEAVGAYAKEFLTAERAATVVVGGKFSEAAPDRNEE